MCRVTCGAWRWLRGARVGDGVDGRSGRHGLARARVFFCDGLHFVFDVVFHFVFSSSPLLPAPNREASCEVQFGFRCCFVFCFQCIILNFQFFRVNSSAAGAWRGGVWRAACGAWSAVRGARSGGAADARGAGRGDRRGGDRRSVPRLLSFSLPSPPVRRGGASEKGR